MKKILRKIYRRVRTDIKLSRGGKWGSLWNYRHGFHQSTIDVCGITKQNYKEFISDRDYLNLHPINGAYTSIIDNKLWLPMLLMDYKDLVPTYFFFILKGEFFDFQTKIKTSIVEVLECLRENRNLACKHTHSSLGVGFFKLSFYDGSYRVNGVETQESDLISKLKKLDQYILTEYIDQHIYSKTIAPDSLNTIRLLTVKPTISDDAIIVRAFHRFGANGSVVDNLSAGCGGVLSYVNPKTGILSGNGVVNKEKDVICTNNIIHPDSGVSLANIQIPHYEIIKKTILNFINSHPYLKYVGWDIAVTEDSFKIIEANSLTSLSTIQQDKGFFADENIRKLFDR